MPVLGVRAHDYPYKSPHDLFSAISAAGFSTLQLAVPKSFDIPYPLSGDMCREISDELSRAKLTLSVLGCYVDPASPNDDIRRCSVETFCNGLITGRELGAKCVGTETSIFSGTPKEHEAAFERLTDSIMRMTEKAEKVGIDIGIEPVWGSVIDTPERALELKRRVNSKRIRWIFDVVNMLPYEIAEPHEAYIQKCIDALGDDITAVHVKDALFRNGERKQPMRLFCGDVNWNYVLNWAGAYTELPLIRDESKSEFHREELTVMKDILKSCKRVQTK